MIWGMTLEPGKLYTETMGEEVQLSMAAIDSRKYHGEAPSTNFCQIVIQTEKGEYVLCTLVHGIMFQQNLDLKLMPREKVTFSVQGPSVVYLVGYTASYPEDEEEMGMRSEDYEDDSSAWESLQEGTGDPAISQIKKEPLEILEDSDAEIRGLTDEVRPQIAASSSEQTEGAVTGGSPPRESGGEEIGVETVSVVKIEAPESDVDPDITSNQQMTPQVDLHGIQTTDQGVGLPQTSMLQDFLYPDLHQQQSQSQILPNAAEAFCHPAFSDPENQYEQSFSQTQSTSMQRVQDTPARHPSPAARVDTLSDNTQRTYPLPRRQYGANRLKSPGRGRVQSTQESRNVQQHQQVALPGTSQQDVPGPSASGIWVVPVGDKSHFQKMPVGADLPATVRSTSQSRHSASRKPSNVGKSVNSTMRVIFCQFCGKQFTDKLKHKKHQIYHERIPEFLCSVCSKAFHSGADLERHQRVHTGEKPFQCRVCRQRFSRKSSLKRHEQIHYSQNLASS